MASMGLVAPWRGSGLAAAGLDDGSKAEPQDAHERLLHQPTMVAAEVAQMPHLRRLLSTYAPQLGRATEPAAIASQTLLGHHHNRVHPEPLAGTSVVDDLLYETPRCHAMGQLVAIVLTALAALPCMRTACCLLAKKLAITHSVPDLS